MEDFREEKEYIELNINKKHATISSVFLVISCLVGLGA